MYHSANADEKLINSLTSPYEGDSSNGQECSADRGDAKSIWTPKPRGEQPKSLKIR